MARSIGIGMSQVALILSVLLSCVGAWIIAHRYRRRMQQLMSVPRAPDPSVPVTESIAGSPPPTPVSLTDNGLAGMRLTMLLMGMSFLIAVTSTVIWAALSFPGEPLKPKAVAAMSVFNLWPVIPVLALLWRWSSMRLFGTLLLWCGVSFPIFSWGFELKLVQTLAMMAEIPWPLVLMSLVFWGNATRAIAPWLLIPAALLMWTSLAGLGVFMFIEERQSPVLMSLLNLLQKVLGWHMVYAAPILFAILPWPLAWWPARVLGRALGRAYSRKWLSDLLVVFTGVWVFSLTDRALTVATDTGVAAVAMYLPLLAIPALMWLTGARQPRGERPPTLLVLRVFQQDAQTQFLFDHVVERWRLSGNTVMIAGTDLADRTVDAEDIFQFLDGRLAERFVVSPGDVARRIAAFDMIADIDGRYRVNDCYCHDTTWQDALQALVHYSDVVLMDLRGFQAHNAGCRYELATLAQASRDLSVVVLTDARTDRAAAQEAVASGRQERFTWIEALRFDARKRREVLASLFA